MTRNSDAAASRLQYVDIARGIAIICIILSHLGNWPINRVVFTFHVPIFFFITGYFTDTRRSVSEFVRVKARTLLVPYYVTCFVIIVIAVLLGAWKGEAFARLKEWSYAMLYAAGDNYTEPFYIKAIGPLWFLWASFWGSCFLRISLKLKASDRLCLIAVLFALGYFSRKLFWFPLSIQAGACASAFMYMGWLLQQGKSILPEIPKECKSFAVVFALLTWYFFIRDFQSFWLVHCDIGRGIVDVFGCICACSIVILLSYLIEKKTSSFGAILAYLGRYSLLVLCLHVIELNLFPWGQITEWLIARGFIPANFYLGFIIIGKLCMDLGGAWILSRIPVVRKIMGYRYSNRGANNIMVSGIN